ncbi:MAG TPA: hypothetical protein VFM98_08460 [Ramlibacter sp.]|uniref:hypothetical protein n=1 Tax=Ramlibacter sp. TaxID=1917967 RepID=UPI002D800A6C|nr:hypothetical protein [Ramlibacter sp.]HET8745623.1 hypothetical protein [Ramlibacter sp.]
MSKLSRVSCHAVHELGEAAREALARELFGVHVQIFGGLDFAGFRHYVIDRPSWRTWIWVKRNEQGKPVGYHATHVFLLDVQGRPSAVVRMEAGTLPQWRGRDLIMVNNCLRLLRLWLQAPRRDWCIFAALTHPSSYTFLSHYAPVIWPRADQPTPPEVQRQMEELADAFGLERVDPADPMVREVKWITRETEQDRARWHASRRPNARLYLRANPGYVRGHGLLTLIPMNGAILLRAAANFLVGRAGRLARILAGQSAKPAADPTPASQPAATQSPPPVRLTPAHASDFAPVDFPASRH